MNLLNRLKTIENINFSKVSAIYLIVLFTFLILKLIIFVFKNTKFI